MVDDRSNLKPVEMSFDSFAVRLFGNVSGKLYLHRALHGMLSLIEHEVESVGKRQCLVAENIVECHHATAASFFIVFEHTVDMVICGDHVFECACAGKILHVLFSQIRTFIELNTEVVLHIGRKCEHFGLCIAQGQVEGRCLEYIVGVLRRKTKTAATVYYIFAKTDGNLHNAIFGTLVTERIIVERTSNARKRREVISGMRLAYYFLNNHGHFLLIDNVARRRHVAFARLIKNRGIHAFYCIG